MAKKYLHLCSRGINRSPTSASIAREIAREKGLDIKMFSSGFDNLVKNVSNENRNYFEQYDLLIVMEGYMRRGLIKLGIPKKNIRCLEIPDEYQRNDPVLVDILKESLKLYIREEPL